MPDKSSDKSPSKLEQARLLDHALTKIQRADLLRLLGNDALVERVAGAIALHKTAKFIVPDPAAVTFTDRDFDDLHSALNDVERLLTKAAESTGSIFGTAAGYIAHRLHNPIIGGRRVPAPYTFDDTRVAVIFLNTAIAFIRQQGSHHSGWGARETSGELMHSLVGEIVRESGKPLAQTFAKVMEIALIAGGEDSAMFDTITERIKARKKPSRHKSQGTTSRKI
jgi:hypothetical protein